MVFDELNVAQKDLLKEDVPLNIKPAEPALESFKMPPIGGAEYGLKDGPVGASNLHEIKQEIRLPPPEPDGGGIGELLGQTTKMVGEVVQQGQNQTAALDQPAAPAPIMQPAPTVF